MCRYLCYFLHCQNFVHDSQGYKVNGYLENLRPLLNRNIPLISGKYSLRNQNWPLESGFSHEQKWEKVRKRGLKQWNPSYAILYVNTISKQLSDQIFVQKWPRNKLLSFLERLDSPNCRRDKRDRTHWPRIFAFFAIFSPGKTSVAN